MLRWKSNQMNAAPNNLRNVVGDVQLRVWVKLNNTKLNCQIMRIDVNMRAIHGTIWN